jgi:hypothetical protein
VRALFFPVLASAIFLAPAAYGSSVQPGPYDSAPTDKSFIVTFVTSPGTRSSYLVDRRGYFWPNTSHNQIGVSTANDGTSDKAFSLKSFSANDSIQEA